MWRDTSPWRRATPLARAAEAQAHQGHVELAVIRGALAEGDEFGRW